MARSNLKYWSASPVCHFIVGLAAAEHISEDTLPSLTNKVQLFLERKRCEIFFNEIVLSLLALCVFISVGGIYASEKFGFVNDAAFKELNLFYVNNQYF